MSNALQTFSDTEFGDLSVVEIDGKPYFAATRCAKILGHKNPQRAIREFCKGVTETVTPSEGGLQTIKIIPEGDVYRLIARSKLPSAERFERWVFDEVLPEIRRTGSYAASGAAEKQIATLTNIVETLTNNISAISERVTELTRMTVHERHGGALTPSAIDAVVSEYTEAQLAEIGMWRAIIRQWRTFRRGAAGSKDEADSLYIERCREKYPGIVISRAVLYSKQRAYVSGDPARLLDRRGGSNKGESSIPAVCWNFFALLRLENPNLSMVQAYTLTRAWTEREHPELLEEMPSERTFRRRAG